MTISQEGGSLPLRSSPAGFRYPHAPLKSPAGGRGPTVPRPSKPPITQKSIDNFPKAEYKTENLGDVIWKYIEIPIREGKYRFQVNYDWRAVWVSAGNGKDGKSPEGAALNNKMGELFKAEAWSNDGSAWASEDTSWPSLASCKDDTTLYLAHLSKLSPQEAAEKIISIARALESVNA